MDKGLEISFSWLFAIIVGAVILFLAIYISTKLIGTEQTALDARTAKEIGVLLNPLETGFEEGKVTSMNLPSETRIYNRCYDGGSFGAQRIQVSQKSFNKWTETDVEVSFGNKYIFSEEYVEGKEFYLFSMPVEFPFKVGNLIYMTSKNQQYCFDNPPESVERTLSAFSLNNVLLEECEGDEIKVCFSGGSDCEVRVNYGSKTLEKNNEIIQFESDSLMYAAIFSDKEVYECQLRRLMKRVGSLALLYRDKSVLVSDEECNSNLNSDLLSLMNSVNNYGDSNDLSFLRMSVEQIENKNDIAECRLW